MKLERWKKLGEPFSRYSVSDFGRVKNDDTGYIFINCTKSCGYVKASLVDDAGIQRYRLVHCLVAVAFIGKQDGVVHHKDGNRENNTPNNLEYLSQKQNCLHKLYYSERKSRAVVQCTMGGEFVKRWNRISDIPQAKNGKANIIAVCRGRLKSAYGFVWRYEEDKINGEIWKPIITNGKRLAVSSEGRVRLTSGKVTRGYWHNGYRIVNVYGKSVFVHRLVCAAFHSIESPDGLVVNHKDFDKNNNREDNLEWISQQANCVHGAKNRSKESRVRRVAVVRSGLDGRKVYDSIEEAYRDTGISKGNICMVCKGERKTAGGFIWEYAVV